jgi:hypothetical protein
MFYFLAGLPGDVFVRVTGSAFDHSSSALGNHIVIPASILQEHVAQNSMTAPTGWEIVLWKPVRDVIALQLWPLIVESRRAPQPTTKATPVIILGGSEDEQAEEGPTDFGPQSIEFQMQQAQPITTPAAG